MLHPENPRPAIPGRLHRLQHLLVLAPGIKLLRAQGGDFGLVPDQGLELVCRGGLNQ